MMGVICGQCGCCRLLLPVGFAIRTYAADHWTMDKFSEGGASGRKLSPRAVERYKSPRGVLTPESPSVHGSFVMPRESPSVHGSFVMPRESPAVHRERSTVVKSAAEPREHGEGKIAAA